MFSVHQQFDLYKLSRDSNSSMCDVPHYVIGVLVTSLRFQCKQTKHRNLFDKPIYRKRFSSEELDFLGVSCINKLILKTTAFENTRKIKQIYLRAFSFVLARKKKSFCFPRDSLYLLYCL